MPRYQLPNRGPQPAFDITVGIMLPRSSGHWSLRVRMRFSLDLRAMVRSLVLCSGMQGNDLETSLVIESQRPSLGSGEFSSAMDEAAGKIRQAQDAVDFTRQFHHCLRPATMKVRPMEIWCYSPHHGLLVPQLPGTPDGFPWNVRAVQ